MTDLLHGPEDLDMQPSLDGVAVIGMSLRVPGASDLATFWKNLCDGVCSISFFTDEELVAAGVDPELLRDPSYVRARGVPAGVDLFDAGFFGFTPREAETMDPQHRLFLENAWQAMENAGYDSASYEGPVGVFAGSNVGSYLIHNLVPHPELIRRIGPLQIRIRNDKDFLATLASYKLNLKGPSVNVQTACSTSLVSVCLACQSLLGYQCDMALAGGVSITSPPRSGYLYQEGVYAPDGRCRAFDAEAQGTVLGDGITVVLLKRLQDALADGDTIHAVIKGFATNNDGSLKLDYTAPSVDGQAEVIATAHALGEIDPGTIGYVETHGTGTPLGDVIEIAALTQAFSVERRGFCAIGSLKTNIGHLDAAAGTASLIKTVLALAHGKVPPSLHFKRPNPRLDLERTPFFVNSELRPFPASPGSPRRAGVSSFGVGGTNAHVVVEEAPAREPSGPSRPWQLLVLSARSAEALESAAANLAGHLEAEPGVPLADVAHTLQRGRRAFGFRRALVCRDTAEAARLLRGSEPRRLLSAEVPPDRQAGVAFLFSGIGDHYPGMARGLYEGEPVFREQVDLCARRLEPLLGLDLRSLLYPKETRTAASGPGGPDLRRMLRRNGDPEPNEEMERLSRTAVLHPAMFAVELALARLWMSWGIRPQAMIGYSIGEYAAACVAGVFSLEQALELVAARARIIDGLPRGAMLAVSLPEAELAPRLDASLSLAAVNGPAFCVAAGPGDAVAALEASLSAEGIQCRRLQATHAFHSRMLEPALDSFRRIVAPLDLREPEIPFVSNVTGTWITPAQATDPGYWAEHMCRTVRFGDGVTALWSGARRVLLEIGPGNSLCSIALQSAGGEAGSPLLAVSSLPHAYDPEPDRAVMTGALGRLWLSGIEPDWKACWTGESRRRVPLPTYPFERQRFWIDPPKPGEAAASERGTLDKQADLSRWFYLPVWRQSTPIFPGEGGRAGRPWLVLPDRAGLAARLAERLRREGREVLTAEEGEMAGPERLQELIAELQRSGRLPGTVLHLGSYGPVQSGPLDPDEAAGEQDRGFFSLLFLAQAWADRAGREPLRLVVVASGIHEVTGGEDLDPRRATLIGPCRVIPQEMPGVDCVLVDLPASGVDERTLGLVLAEAEGGTGEPVVAFRGGRRWVEDFDSIELGRAGAGASRLRDRGSYLITGGLGGIGLTLAERLAEQAGVRLALVGRTALPPEGSWEAALAADGDGELARQIRGVRGLRDKGAEVLVLSADVTCRDQMEAVKRTVLDRFGAVHGVIHAAGVPPGGLLQLKSRETAAAVLAPKVTGTLVLSQVFADQDLDFLLLCSSLTAATGAFGLIDHCAANAFLDAFAQRASREGRAVLSVGWDSWLEVGQAARAGVATRLRAVFEAEAPAQGDLLHPLLGRRTGGEGGRELFVHRLSPREHWVLGEHRFRGQAILPATAFLEMARAAHAAVAGEAEGQDLLLTDVVFARPLVIPDGESREVLTALSSNEEGWELRIASRAPGAAVEQEHVRGRIRLAAPAASPGDGPGAPDPGWIERSADLAASLAAGSVELGPRWTGLLRELRCGEREGWARLEVPDEFRSDLDAYGLHPALLDAATGLGRLMGEGAHLPFRCRSLRMRAPLPAVVISRFRCQPEAAGEGELVCDVALFDEGGRAVVEMEGYTLRRAGDPDPLRREVSRPPIQKPKAADDAFGITPREGAEAFGRLLTRRLETPRVLVSSRDFRAVRERLLRHMTGAELDKHLEVLRAAGTAHPRPSLHTPYEAPRTELEERLVRLYREMLGIERVGIHDDFFDLGGNSLVATQLISRLRDELEVEISLRALFEAPTVAQLGRVVVQSQIELVEEEELADALAELQGMSREELLERLAGDMDA